MMISKTGKTINVDFLVAGNDNPKIVAFNLRELEANYPDSTIYLYDWGCRKEYLDEYRQANSNLRIIKWKKANITNYMYHKVLCIRDYYEKGHRNKLIYIDTDVVVHDNFDEIFTDEWDVGVIWRPEYNEYFNTEQWLNAGTIFFNDLNINNVIEFIELWKNRCDLWKNKAWWLDQVELIRIFKEVNASFRDNCNMSGMLAYGSAKIRLRTFDWSVYNYYPDSTYHKDKERNRPKIVHFKSKNRKQLFNVLPQSMIKIWLASLGKGIHEKLVKYLLDGILLAVKVRMRLQSSYFSRRYGKDSEIYYWKVTALKKKPLYDFVYFRANEVLKIFYELNGCEELDIGPRVLDVGPGPGGGVLDLCCAKEKWAIEPNFDQYCRNNVWIARDDTITIRNTTAEDMSNVPDDYFDSVFAINSIDHGGDISVCFKNIYKALHNGGRFYLHVHCRTSEQTNKLHTQSFNGNDLERMLMQSDFTMGAYKFYSEDPLSSTYNTFMGILRK